MKPGKQYSLECIAKMHELDYFMIVHDDLDGMSGGITSFTTFEELKNAFLKTMADYPDIYHDPLIFSDRKIFSYSANLLENCRIEIKIGNLKKREVANLYTTLGVFPNVD